MHPHLMLALAAAAAGAAAGSMDLAPPGHEPYQPTRLEWAALTLQAAHAGPWDANTGIIMSFRAASDGFTVLCVLRYPSATPTQALALVRDNVTQIFTIFREAKGWSWLRLEFREEALGKPAP